MPDTRAAMLSDQIARIAKGDRQAFDALYQATSARLNAVCLSVLRDRKEAEEALEDVYIHVWKKARDFADGGLSARAWLVTLARDQAVRRLRATGPAPVGTVDVSRPEEAVRMAYLQGLSLDAFSARAGVPPEAARQRLRDGLAALGAAEGEDMQAAERALGTDGNADAGATFPRHGTDPATLQRIRAWQERLALFADDLTPVMAPARARQRIRENLGHGLAPLAVDPLERAPWWRGTGTILAAILLAAALAWYFFLA